MKSLENLNKVKYQIGILKYLDEVDAKHATNHLVLINKIDCMSKDLTQVKDDVAFIKKD
jgi:hypothetical protein